MPETFLTPPWRRDEGFELLCDRMLAVFPEVAPDMPADEAFGDYAEARHAFERFGSDWSESAIFENRSAIVFVNAEGFLFLLPRMISASLKATGFDPDVCECVISGLELRRPEFSVLFTAEQRHALVGPLLYLWGGIDLEFGLAERHRAELRRIIHALRD